MAGRLLTVPEVAEMLRTPEGTVRYWRHMGHGPAGFKLGRRVVFREEDVLAWLDSQAKADADRRQGVA